MCLFIVWAEKFRLYLGHFLLHLRLLLPCFGMCLGHGNCLCGDKGCSFLF